MKYRTRLYFAFAIISFVSSLLAIGFVFFEAKRLLRVSFAYELKAVVSVTAGFLDGEEIAKIRKQEDEKLPLYHKYRTLLMQLQKGLTSEGLPIAHFYTIHKMEGAPSELLFGLNTADDPHQVLPPGLSYSAENKAAVLKHFGTSFTSDTPYFGAFGKWFSAFSPIVDNNKQVVGMLGIDVSADSYYKEIDRLFNTHLIALLVSLLTSVILAFFFSQRVTRSLRKFMDVVEYVSHGHFDIQVDHKMDGEFAELTEEINKIGKALIKHTFIENNFSSYVSYPVLQSLLRSPPPLKGERRTITALFGDLSTFTKNTQAFSPEEIVSLLNTFFEAMIDIAFKFKGTLENFRGDGFLVLFGAPVDDPKQERHAIQAAQDMVKAWENLQRRERDKPWDSEQLNIGIHTGPALIGGIGKDDTIHYTAIGNTIHLAQEIAWEGRKKHLPLIISQKTWESEQQLIDAEKLPDLSFTQQTGSIAIYAVKTRE